MARQARHREEAASAWRRVTAGILLGLLAGCSTGDSPPPQSTTPAPNSTSTTITAAAGGTLTSQDGKATLTFPPGAVAQDTVVTITPVDPKSLPASLQGADLAFDLKPDGPQFAQPVQVSVTVPETPKQPDGSLQVALGSLLTATGNTPEALGNQTITVDGDNNQTTISGTLTHFSPLTKDAGLFLKESSTGESLRVGGMTVKLSPLPNELEVGAVKRASSKAIFEAEKQGHSLAGDFKYKAVPTSPLEHLPESGSTPDSDGFRPLTRPADIPNGTEFDLGGYGNYRCNDASERAASILTVKLVNGVLIDPNVTIPLRLADKTVVFLTTHKCVESTTTLPPPPPPPPPPSPPAGALIVPVVPKPTDPDQLLRAFTEFEVDSFFGLFTITPPPPAQNMFGAGTTNPGLHLLDISTGQTIHSRDLPGMPMDGVVAHFKGGLGCLFGYGATGSARTCFNQATLQFDPPELSQGRGPFTDAGLVSTTEVPTPPIGAPQHLLWHAENGNLRQEFQPGGPNTAVAERLLDPVAWYAAGGAPTGSAKSAFFSPTRVLVVRGQASQPGQLWFGDPASPTGGTLVGSLSANSTDTRKIRCALPICAVSNFGGLVTIVTWDGVNAPAILGTIPNTTGSHGIDATAEGANRAIRSTDSLNQIQTVTKTVVTPAGAMVSNITKQVPPGCTDPRHVLDAADPQQPGQPKTVVSCNGINAQDQSALAVLDDNVFFVP
jgi:hypothetical protein